MFFRYYIIDLSKYDGEVKKIGMQIFTIDWYGSDNCACVDWKKFHLSYAFVVESVMIFSDSRG